MATLSKEEYLKRYISSDTTKKKKRKKKTGPAAKQTNVRIIDDDIDLKSINPLTAAAESEDEAPTVAEFIDERPEHVRRLEEYRLAGKWKTMGKDKDENDIASKEYGVISSGSKGDGKASTSQIQLRHDSDSDPTPSRRRRHDSDSDSSPCRRKRHDSDSDHSPPRKQQGEKNSSTVHQNSSRIVHGKSNLNSGRISDDKRTQQNEGSASGRKRHDSDSDQSPHRKQRHASDSDQSPPRSQQRHDNDSDQSPLRKQRHDSDSDQSPPRKGRLNSDPDQLPARKQNSVNSDSRAQKRRWDSDQSPPRRRKGGSDPDQSPPRRKQKGSDTDQSPPRRKGNSNGKTETKPNKTLSGAKAGLSSAAEMKQEAERLKKREDEMFSKIDRDALGKGAKTIFRDKSGKRRDLAAEKKEEEEEAKKKAEMDKKYKEWGQGLKQKEMQEQNVQDYVHEMSKPLARYKDDDDLDRVMREMDRDGDPMAKFIKKKTTQNDGSANDKPRYRGPAPPPNRFGILPGYRWDGVDRSNGFEKKIFAKMAEKKAVKEHAYKWSTEDM